IMYFSTFLFALVTLAAAMIARAAVILSRDTAVGFAIRAAQMAHWLATTDANLTFIGARPPNPLSPRSAQSTYLIYCTNRAGNVCGGSCTVYNGGAQCIYTPSTECLWATQDVGFCDKKECNGDCSSLSLCGTYLDSGFCYTPGTKSIVTSPL
ncbi:hypothetical protein GY45DRAFT_1242294, partial [Cubamyces sp. BRFM 1775]